MALDSGYWEIPKVQIPSQHPIEHHYMNQPVIDFEDGIYKYREKIFAECLDMQEDAVVQAVVRMAKDAGVTQLWLLDKKFVLDALVTAIEKWRADHEA